MTKFEKKVRQEIIKELDIAEKIYKDVKDDLIEKSNTYSRIDESLHPTKIPGFPLVESGKGKVGNFIAFFLDIRDSTAHLTQAISEKTAKASQLERVYYETTAINTCGIHVINEHGGRITEFLGDGFLALFEAIANNDVYKAHNAAKCYLSLLEKIINPILAERYTLPGLKIGIGLAYSKAIVTVIGNGDDTFPKAIGECVYRASKLSKGHNEVHIDDKLKYFWPKSKDGTLKFNELTNLSNVSFKGYKVS